MIQTLPVATLPAVPSSTDWDCEKLLQFAGTARRALVIADQPLGAVCALLHRGCAAAMSIRPVGKPDGEFYDLMLLPRFADIGSPDAIVRKANRWLAANGRLIIGGLEPSVRPGLTSRLRLNGFRIIATGPQITTLCAERRRAPQ